MSINDIIFKSVVTGETVYDPETISSTQIILQVTNLGDEDLSDLGFYIVPATSIGDVDYPADFAPETDYEDILTWGTRVELGEISQGGLWISTPTNDGSFAGYVTREAGSLYTNKISCKDLVAGETMEITLRFDTPDGESARRFFIDLKLE